MSRGQSILNQTADQSSSSSSTLRRSHTSPSRRSASPASISGSFSPNLPPAPGTVTQPNDVLTETSTSQSDASVNYDSLGSAVPRQHARTRAPTAGSGSRGAAGPFAFRTRWLSSDSAGVALTTLSSNDPRNLSDGGIGGNLNSSLDVTTRSARLRRVPLHDIEPSVFHLGNNADTIRLARDVLANSRNLSRLPATTASSSADDTGDTLLHNASFNGFTNVPGASGGLRRRRRGGWMQIDANGDEVEVSSEEDRESGVNSLDSNSAIRRGINGLGWRWRPASPIFNNEGEDDKPTVLTVEEGSEWVWESRSVSGSEARREGQYWRFRGNREMVGR